MLHMCYSAQIQADWRKYRREYGVDIALADFYELFFRRLREGSAVKVPKAIEVAFADPQSDAEREIAALIAEFNAAQTVRLEQELFKQRKRLADAERSLQTKATKTAAESRRIASDKIEWARSKLASLRTPELTLDEQRIFPGHYAPVIVLEAGRRIVKPMRYQCRPAGVPASYDRKFPGTYNARRDSLGGFWRNLFGYSHGVMVVSAFFENVDRDGANAVLEFRPRPRHDMLVACLWSRWRAPGEPDLLSFAAITDEPPPEVAAAGHDRCIVPIKPTHLDVWLDPRGRDVRALQAVLDDRDAPYYEHRLAA
jgi:putative SOS response-associated peptidase YedK